MTVNVAQVVWADDGGFGINGPTRTVTIVCGDKSFIHLGITYDISASPTISSVTSVPALTWTAQNSLPDVTDGQEIADYVSSATNGAGTSYTITVTFSASIAVKGAAAAEITGSSGADTGKKAGQLQATPGTGSDVVSSGLTAALTSQPALISSFSIDMTGTNAPAAGTGFASVATPTGWLFATAAPFARHESKRLTSASAVAATFTPGGNRAHATLAVIFLESVAVVITEEQRLRRQNRPGRTPYSFGKYFRPVGALSQPAASLRTLTLTANLGSFAMTAVAAGLLHGRLNSAGFASFALTLPTTNLDRNHTIVPAFGSFALSAQAANLIRNRTLVAAMASFGLTGEAANLFKTKLLSVAAGSFAMTGEPIGFVRSHVIAASVGVFAMIGEAAGLLRNRISAMLRGSFILTGEPATLTKFSASSFAFASFVLAGQVASFHGNKRLAGNFAAFVFNAENVNLHVQSSFTRSISRTLAIAGEVRVYSPGAEIRTYTVTNEVRNINPQA